MYNPLIEAAVYSVGGCNLKKSAICVLDKHSYIKFSNSSFGQMFKISPEKSLGVHLSEFIVGNHHPHGSPDNLTDMTVPGNESDTHEYEAGGVIVARTAEGEFFHAYVHDLIGGRTGAGEFIMRASIRIPSSKEIEEFNSREEK